MAGSAPIAATRRPRWLLLAIAALGAGLVVAVVSRFPGRALDDQFITYRYAQNLALGRGLVFNPGERVFGVTEPGVAILLAGLHRATAIEIAVLGTLGTAAALALLALLVAGDLDSRDRLPEGVLAALLLLTSTALWRPQGAAAPWVLVLLLIAANILEGRPVVPKAASRRGSLAPAVGRHWGHDAIAGLLAGAAVWLRPDAVIGAVALSVLATLARRRIPWAFAFAALGVGAAGAAAATVWFGTPLPQTLIAKRYHAALFAGARDPFDQFWGFALRAADGDRWWVVSLIVAGALGAALLLRDGTLGLRLLVANGALLFVAYPLLRVPFFDWYAVPVIVPLLVGAALLLGTLLRALRAWRGSARCLAAAASAALIAAVFARGVSAVAWWQRGDAGDWRRRVYGEGGAWLRTHTAPGARIAFNEVGMLAYWSDRHVEDLLGLVSPGVLPYVRIGDIAGGFLARPTEYFLTHPMLDVGFQRALIDRDWFRQGYQEVASWPVAGTATPARMYRRRPDAILPPPRPPRARAAR